jgi:hypothetical protein
MVGEIDFLIVSPEGLLVLEVKGGRVALDNGIWIYKDRFGKDHRNGEGPFKQGQSAMFALRKRLDSLVSLGTLESVPFSWGAVFPDIRFTETSPEWTPAQVIDAGSMESPAALQRALKGLAKHARELRTRRRKRVRELSGDHVRSIVEAIRPTFDLVPSLRRRNDDLGERRLSLTKDQYRWLDASADFDRLFCDGGAGTGKTFLAAEAARREAAAGHTVTVTCRSPVLAGFLAGQPGMDHQLINVTPLARIDQLQPCQSLVVDEGQDIMNLDDITTLESHLEGGWKSGRWRMFLDRNHQAGVLGLFEPDAVELLETFAQSRIHLPENCRNTSNIIDEVTRALGVDMGRCTTGPGPVPIWRWWSIPAEASDELGQHLDGLFRDGIEPEEITILTGAAPEADPVIAELPGKFRALVEPLSENSVNRPAAGKIGAARIGLFKGLENDFVCVTDLPSLDETLNREGVAELYVAMTRPRAGLWMGLPSRLKNSITSLSNRTDVSGQ